MITLLILLLCSLWSILLIDMFVPFSQFKDWLGLGYKRKLVSGIPFIDYIIYLIHKIFNCSLCFSAYLFFFVYWIYFNSLFGFFLMPVAYFLTFIIKEKIINIKL